MGQPYRTSGLAHAVADELRSESQLRTLFHAPLERGFGLIAIAASTRPFVQLGRKQARQFVRIERHGRDRYGRTLARLGDLGEILVQEGLARRWGDRRGWCGPSD